jgi:hypothetical protein
MVNIMEGPCDTCAYYKRVVVSNVEHAIPQEICKCFNPDCPEHSAVYVFKFRCSFWSKRNP